MQVNSSHMHPPLGKPPGKPQAFEKIGQMPGSVGKFLLANALAPAPTVMVKCLDPSPSAQYR